MWAIFTAYVEMYHGQTLTVAEYPQEITDVKTLYPSNISIYPNPTSGTFTIENKSLTYVIITDISGKIIFQSDIKGRTQDSQASIQIDLSGVRKGIYLLQIKTAKSIYAEKLIVY